MERNKEDRTRAALNHQLDLEDKVAQLLTLARVGQVEQRDLISRLESISEDTKSTSEFFSDNVSATYYGERRAGQAQDTAQRVFDIPELLEHILSFLPALEVLKAQTINKQFRDAVDGSVERQRKLLLKTPEKVVLLEPPYVLDIGRLPGLGIEGFGWPHSYNKEGILTRQVECFLRIDLHKYKIGTRCRQMQILHPAPHSIWIKMPCCGEWFNFKADGPCAYVSKNAFGSIGFLMDYAAGLMAKHKLCPYAEPQKHAKFGNVVFGSLKVAAYVKTEVIDPKAMEEKQHSADEIAERAQEESWLKHLRGYVDAKRRANDHSQLIPTLEEYETSLLEQRARAS